MCCLFWKNGDYVLKEYCSLKGSSGDERLDSLETGYSTPELGFYLRLERRGRFKREGTSETGKNSSERERQENL